MFSYNISMKTFQDYVFIKILLIKAGFGVKPRILKDKFTKYVENKIRQQPVNSEINNIDKKLWDIWEKIQNENINKYSYPDKEFILEILHY